jgi:hypothetical protein
MDTLALYVIAGAALGATALATWRISRAAAHRGPRWAPTQRILAVASAATKGLSRVQRSAAARRLQRAGAQAQPVPAATAAAAEAPALPAAAEVPAAAASSSRRLQTPASLHAAMRRLRTGGTRAQQAGVPEARVYIGSVELVPRPVVAPPPAAARVPPRGRTPERGLPPGKRPAMETRTPQALADDFMQWLGASIAAEETPVNTPQAPVHMGAEGLLLVYPAIFQAYLKTCAAPVSLVASAAVDKEKALLKALCEPGWHQRGLLNSHLLHFQLQQPDKVPAFLRGLVIRAPQRFVSPLPRANPALTRLF